KVVIKISHTGVIRIFFYDSLVFHLMVSERLFFLWGRGCS
ncbi:hypothetical protein ECOK1357_5339, partial [Escherichia coli OK1357]